MRAKHDGSAKRASESDKGSNELPPTSFRFLMIDQSIQCRVLRCARQDEMYIYLRNDLSEDDIPEALRERAGALTEVMQLELTPQRTLARVDVLQVMQRLRTDGVFLQLPPQDQLNPRLHFGD